MKLVIDAAATGHDGRLLANQLREQQVEPEYADEDTLVMMFSPDVDANAFLRIKHTFADFQPRKPRQPLTLPEAGPQVLTPRQAMLTPREVIATISAIGRICAGTAVSCPPAIPIVVLGEKITANGAALMEKLGINKIPVCIR